MASRKPVQISKEKLRAQSERAMKEVMERKLEVKPFDSRKEVKCGTCGAPNKVTIEAGQARGEFKCKDCGEKQRSL
jgi:DNA-directed RNA polymerase subunit RPC12/RpoP